MKRLCVQHGWSGTGRCPDCAKALPMDPTVMPAERALTMTLAFIDGGVFTPEQAAQLRERLKSYGGGRA